MPSDNSSRSIRVNTLESRVFLGLVLLSTAFFLWMIHSFLSAIFWAVVFAILFEPLHNWIRAKVGERQKLAAALSTISVIFVVLIPAGFLIAAVAQQALGVLQRMQTGQINISRPFELIERAPPGVTDFLSRFGIEPSHLESWIDQGAAGASQWIAARLFSFGQNALTVGVMFLVMLYVLFYLFRDGEWVLKAIVRVMPMGDEREWRLFRRFAQVARATVKGSLVVALVQGLAGGILFAIAGIKAAVFWAVMMGVFSILPAVGPALVWLPAGIYLLSSGSIGDGMVVLIGGSTVVSLSDNILRPVLIGRETKLPDYLVLVATLGGLIAFGVVGFVAGPIIAALCLVMWEMFADEYASFDSSEPFVEGLLIVPSNVDEVRIGESGETGSRYD
ncbi:MAG: AI-2E family transporter [Gemmatimonadota bacterium]|jgi:predicted PurR-regulated permease PerM|nr:AI-2E family transporter [Gemmatimonadota bacterium]